MSKFEKIKLNIGTAHLHLWLVTAVAVAVAEVGNTTITRTFESLNSCRPPIERVGCFILARIAPITKNERPPKSKATSYIVID